MQKKYTMIFMLFSLSSLSLLTGCNGNHSAHHTVHDKLRSLVSLQADDKIGGHKISVTPCVNAERQTTSDTAPENSKHVLKCGNAEVVLENEVLSVNGKSYGKLAEKATIKVENQKVFINNVETQPITQVAQN